MTIRIVDELAGVRTTLNYLFRTDKKPYSYTFEPPAGTPARFGEVNAVPDVFVRDARLIAEHLSLDKQGFVLRQSATAVRDFYNEDEIRNVYYPELEQLLRAATGAEKIVIFDHTIRSVPKFTAGEKGFRDPVRRVHNDYTATSGCRRVTDHLEPEEAKIRLGEHFAEINVWRPIRGPLEDAPLAVCDAQSIAASDFIPSDLIYPDRVGETYAFAHNPAHRWYYFPLMQRDEALLIKCFDSKEDGRARFTAHTAFDDPTTPPDAFSRESIEVRALVFFGAGT